MVSQNLGSCDSSWFTAATVLFPGHPRDSQDVSSSLLTSNCAPPPSLLLRDAASHLAAITISLCCNCFYVPPWLLAFSSHFSLSVALHCLSDATLLQPFLSHQSSVYISGLTSPPIWALATIVSAITKPRSAYLLPLLASAKFCQRAHQHKDQRHIF